MPWGVNTSSNPPGDITTLTNYSNYDGTNGSLAANSNWETIYRNANQDDFKVYSAGSFSDWDGRGNTSKIITYRNELLTTADVEIPTSLAMLEEMYNAYVTAGSSSEDYILRLYLYRAASTCYLYEPTVNAGEELAECYKQGKWYLPSEGELARLYWWHRKGYNIPEQMPELECDRPIFANAYAQVSSNNDRLFAAFTSNWYWSSTEAGAGSAWYVVFSNGNCSTHGKYYGSYVSPVVAIEKSSL